MVLKSMDNIKNDFYYIQKITEDLSFIVKHTNNISLEELNENEVLLDSMLFRVCESFSVNEIS